ncbi:MAG: Maf-like protein [Phycisphaeraceae bacterium]|nr:MAG: Maf-like protein [Phycisphaeraceae bacterium]
MVLASTSPRRKQLLEAHGYEIVRAHAVADDGGLAPGSVSPDEWVMSLAYLKASSARAHEDPASPRGVVLGADTICVKNGLLIGQPIDVNDAERILRLLSGGTHEVLTGVALLCPKGDKRVLFCDRSVVRLGALSDEQITAYLATGMWEGKAGGYNLAERIEAGWPIEFEGDETSIMGLPMAALAAQLAAFCDAE